MFSPENTVWINCRNTAYTPHSNECGPHYLLALAVMILHKNPHANKLLPYMNPNLPQQARFWGCIIHLDRKVTITSIDSIMTNPSNISIPKSFDNWTLSPTPAQTLSTIKISHPSHYTCNVHPMLHFTKNHSPYSISNSFITHHSATSFQESTTNGSHRKIKNPISPLPSVKIEIAARTNSKKENRSQDTPNVHTTRKQKLIQSKLPFIIHQDLAQAETWGHSLTYIGSLKTFRVLLQNPNGISLQEGAYQYKYGLSLCKSFDVGAMCISETKLNTNQHTCQEQLKKIHNEMFENSAQFCSQTPETFKNTFQQGGMISLLCESWDTRIMEKGTDPYGLGCWSYFTMRGKSGGKITIITAYRVSTNLAGPMTSTMQEFRKISIMSVKKNNQDRPQPQCQFILDLQAWLEKPTRDGCDIIVALDANEEYQGTGGDITPLEYNDGNHIKHTSHDGTITTLCKTCSLVDPFTYLHTHSAPPPTYIRGKSRLDYIFVSSSIIHTVEGAGILTTFLGDHCPCFLDFSTNSLFLDQQHSIAPRSRRGLQIYDLRKVDTYLDNLHKQFTYHNIEQKVAQLHEDAVPGEWGEDSRLTYEKLDACITESMLYAERQATQAVSKSYEY
jgi:hypothetical protein